jgi:chromosomal replication initiator protein
MTQWSYAKKTGVGVTKGMRFNNFVVGPSNSSAFAVARSVTTDLASRDNPLVLCGQPGTGKTHLLNAMGAQVLESAPDAQVRYVSAGSFSRELAEAAEQGTVAGYLDSLTSHDLLLVDDIHLIETREWAVARLVTVVDKLVERTAQVALTWCSMTPQIPPLTPSLRELFRHAKVVYLWPADGRTKTRIIQKELEDTGLSLPARMVSLLALADTGDIRVLKGLVRNIVARAHLCGESVNKALVEGVLAKLADGDTGR